MFSRPLLLYLIFLGVIVIHGALVDEQGDQKFMCVNGFTVTITSKWSGNIKYEITKQIISTFKDWTLEIHFDSPLTRLEQWFGKFDNSLNVVHENGQVFFIKSNKYNKDLQAQNLKVLMIASYDGIVEPKLTQVALCGYTSADVVYPTQAPTTEPLPSAPVVTPPPPCDETKLKQWNGGIKRELRIPIIRETKHWILELKFDAPWRDFQQWSCTPISTDDNTYICHENGNQAEGSTLKFQYIMGVYGWNAPNLLEAWLNGYHCKN